MKCRKLVYNSETKKQNIVWFGSYGKNEYYQKKETSGDTVFRIPKDQLLITQDNTITFNCKFISGSSNVVLSIILYKNQVPIIPAILGYTFPNVEVGKSYFADLITDTIPTLDFDYALFSFMRFSSSGYLEVSLDLKTCKKAENYSEKGEGVRDSLIQRLSVIKGELWYKASYGLPLTEKIKNKGIYDSIILDIISSHPEVVRIENFESVIKDRKYQLNFEAYTTYNERIKISYLI